MCAACRPARQCRAQTATRPATTQASNRAAVILINSEIDESTWRYLDKQLTAAREAGAKTVILKFDTPGGELHATYRITALLRGITDLHTVAYVERWALSAGAVIAVACDEIVMQDQSVLGDAAPIRVDSNQQLVPLGGDERTKFASPLVEDLRSSARRNGYSQLLLAALVIPQRTVHYLQDRNGKRRFVGPEEYDLLIKEGWSPVEGVDDPVDGPDTLLTLSFDRAEKIGLSRGTFRSFDQFVQERHYEIISVVEPPLNMNLLQLLMNPWLHGIILTIFLQALYISLSHPGHGAAELVAVATLSVLIGVPLLTGYATWWEIAMILIGIVLLALEVFVIPGFGVAGIAGIVLILGGILLTFVAQEPEMPGILPQLPQTWMQLKRGVVVVTAGLACSLFLWFWLQRFLPKLPYFNKLVLTATSGGEGLGVPVVAHEPVKVWPAVGTSGTTITELKPGGSAEFDDPAVGTTRVTDVLSDSGYLDAGEKVIVKENVGMRIIVRRA